LILKDKMFNFTASRSKKSCKMKTHLTIGQRYEIFALLQKKFSQKDIAKSISKDKSVISREIRRNSIEGLYNPLIAQNLYIERLKYKPHKIKFTDDVKQFIDSQIKLDFSPEQIVGRSSHLKIDCVSHERIYQYIWTDKKQGGDLHTHLRHKGRKYRKRGNKKDKRGIIKNRIGIEERPKIVEEKKRIGDLEIDTVIGQNHKGAILTINDRVSKIVFIKKLKGKNAEELANKTIETLSLHTNWIKTITGDNGKEFACHELISKGLNIDFYFARPYHSWERGANENTNGLIRQYFPKKTSFDKINDDDIQRVQDILNNRPRKSLKFLTPIEFFNINLHKNINKKIAFKT